METSRAEHQQYVGSRAGKEVDHVWPLPDSTAINGILISSLSFVFFQSIAFVIARYLKKNAVPSLLNDPTQHWRWKNVSVSFIHAVIVSVCCLICFYQTPKLTADMISTHTPLSHGTVALSAGYFLHDIVDMVVYDRSRNSLELLVHHVVLLIAFSIPILTYKSVGYMLVALLVEINSIFLHFRQLLRIQKVDKKSSLYRLTSLLNLGTFIIFRIAALCWMTRWIVINKANVPFFFYVLANIGLTTTTVMNIVLFYRCLKSDFICHTTSSTTTTTTITTNTKLD